MRKILLSILAVIVGILAGGAVNMGLIMISGSIIPPPEGAILTTEEGLKESMHLMEFKHFLMPFLAHALGTLFGSNMAAILAPYHKMKFAIGIGCWFLIGGIWMVTMVSSPIWFTIVDLVLAYIPMSYLGGKLALKNK